MLSPSPNLSPMATLSSSILLKPLLPSLQSLKPTISLLSLSPHPLTPQAWKWNRNNPSKNFAIKASIDGDYSAKRSSSNNSGEQRETIMLPGCDYNHWLIVMEFPKDPAPTREQMIDTYLNTLATVLGRFVLVPLEFLFFTLIISCPFC